MTRLLCSPRRLLFRSCLLVLALSPGRVEGQARPASPGGGPRARAVALRRYASEHAGDAGRGRRVFASTTGGRCLACHKARGEGGDVGPDLTDIGNKYGRSLL